MRHITIFVLAMASFVVAQMGIMELEPGLSPRYFLGTPPQLAKRQSGICSGAAHHCEDIGQPTLCCPDNSYCYIQSTGQPSCCPLNRQCDFTCSLTEYLCNTTSTITSLATSNLVTATVTTTTVISACCGRACPAYSAFKCPSSLGGSCCSLGFGCALSSCVSTAIPGTTLVSEIPSGCTTSQFSCASSLGGGCCNNGAVCTNSDTRLLCASGTSTMPAIRTGSDGTVYMAVSQDSGLSTGAKAGIGAGVGLFICAIIALTVYFCMKRRAAAAVAALEYSNPSESASGIGPMSNANSSGRIATRPRGARDYFGPNAQAGPYTDQSGFTAVNAHTGGLARGVPISPDSPGDIVPPVEIGNSREHSNVTSPGLGVNGSGIGDVIANGNEENEEEATDYLSIKVPETTEHRVELP